MSVLVFLRIALLKALRCATIDLARKSAMPTEIHLVCLEDTGTRALANRILALASLAMRRDIFVLIRNGWL